MMRNRYFPVVFERFSDPAASLFQGMQGLAERMGVALPAARTALDSGAARELLDRWITASQELQ